MNRPITVRVLCASLALAALAGVGREADAQPAGAPADAAGGDPVGGTPAETALDSEAALKEALENGPALLREDWTGDELERARGFAARLGRAIEAPQRFWDLEDEGGRRFTIDPRGRIRFNPLDDNWRPVIPDSRDAALYNAEAEALYEYGLKDEAVLLWKSLRAMAAYLPDPPAYIRDAARIASARLNSLSEREDFTALDAASDPFPIYDAERDRTLVLSDRHGFRASFPGRWRFMRAAADPERPAGGRAYLQRGDLSASISRDVWQGAWRFVSLDDFILWWDRRRGLTRQEKMRTGFSRSLAADHAERCNTAVGPRGQLRAADANARLAGSRETLCALLDSGVQRPAEFPRYREYFRLESSGGLRVELRYFPRDAAVANTVMAQILDSLR